MVMHVEFFKILFTKNVEHHDLRQKVESFAFMHV